MSEQTKYLKVIECLGELLLGKDDVIKFQRYEIETLKTKINKLEEVLVKERSELNGR